MACVNDDAASAENAITFAFNREPIGIEHVYKWQPHVYDGLSFSFPQKASKVLSDPDSTAFFAIVQVTLPPMTFRHSPRSVLEMAGAGPIHRRSVWSL